MNTLFHSRWHFIAKVTTSGLLLLTAPVVAQTLPSDPLRPNPNLDRFPQPLPLPQPLPPRTPQPVPQPTSPSPELPTVKISIRKIEVTGSTILKQGEITAITRSIEGRTVTFADLQGVANAITQLYLDRGYITSKAILTSQTIVDGIVKIQVVEGSLEKVEVEGTRRLKPDFIRSRINLGIGTPLRTDKIEDQLQLLKLDPLFTNVEASLKPGTETGKSILTVRVLEANLLGGSVSIDNDSPTAVGSERLGISLSDRNLTGNGDELGVAYYRTTAGGASSADIIYRVPINPMNGTIQFRYSPTQSKIIEPPFNRFDITADSSLYEFSYRQPLVRSPRQEFALLLGFAAQNGQNFLSGAAFPLSEGADAQGNSKTRVLKFGQDYLRRDHAGAWAARSQFNFGLDVLNATKNADPTPDGRFFSWQGQAQRVQQLDRNQLLIVQADLQFSPNTLMASQQFFLGGGQSLRGYRQNAIAGDNGVRLSVEDRIAILRDQAGQPNLQLAPFANLGTVWNNPGERFHRLRGETFLAAGGLGLIWEPVPRFLIRASYAIPFVQFSNRGENAQDRGFNFSVVYSF